MFCVLKAITFISFAFETFKNQVTRRTLLTLSCCIRCEWCEMFESIKGIVALISTYYAQARERNIRYARVLQRISPQGLAEK